MERFEKFIVHLCTCSMKVEWQFFKQGHFDIHVIYIEDATDGKISLQNSRSCKEQFKDKDFVALPHSWRLVITWDEGKNFDDFC